MLLHAPPFVDCCFVPLAYFSRMGIFFLLMLKGDLNIKDFLLIFVVKKDVSYFVVLSLILIVILVLVVVYKVSILCD